jgi:hypothetical protein
MASLNIVGAKPVQVRLLLSVLFVLGLLCSVPKQSFDAVWAAPASDVLPGCVNLIQGGDFEAFNPAWQFQPGSRPPAYTTEQAFAGTYSLRIGNGAELPNIASVSEARHVTLLLPSDATSLILRFAYLPLRQNGADAGDVIEVDIFDGTNTLLIPLSVLQTADGWKLSDLNLTPYAGQQISLRFRVRNDGAPGYALLYLDNVELEYCAGTAIPTFTPTAPIVATPTPLATAAVTLTPTPPAPVATPAISVPVVPTVDPTCTNILTDPGFEGWGGWQFGEDPVMALYVTEPRLSGAYAVQLGNPPGQSTNVVSFSSIRQYVTLPPYLTRAELRWWKLLYTAQAGAPGMLSDRQDLILLSPALQPIKILRRELSNSAVWQEDVVDLTPYRGQSFYIYFNAYNDGNGARTWMYLDNVVLNVCGVGGTGIYSDRALVAPTPPAIPLTPIATYTQAPAPTPSPLPTQSLSASATATNTPTAELMPPAALPEPSPTAVVAAPTLAPTFTANVSAAPTLPSNLVVPIEESPTATVSAVGTAVIVTVAPPQTVASTPAIAVDQPPWLDRLGPISVLVGILVLIGFIVWAILRTFRSSRSP